jgi:hypothetical protein
MNGATGKVIPFSPRDDGGDLVETAFMIQGLLTARSFFDSNDDLETNLRSKITELWEDVEWNWYRKQVQPNLFWHWSPNHGFEINLPLRGWNETMIAYILGVGSPTHPLPRNTYHNGWAGQNYENGNSYYGLKLEVGRKTGGPLFFTHYSFLGFDPRGKRDDYANYFFQNQNQTLINRAYCMDNPGNFAGYGPDCWGLTASDDPFGYSAHAPDLSTDNGTITPSAAISSIPYTPVESIRVVRHFLETYGEKIWGEYGFHDAFNPSQGWFATSYLAIDQGPIICMIENHRSQLLWNHFMQNEEVIIALDKIGFTQDDATTSIPAYDDNNTIDIFPNPAHSGLHISFPRLEEKPLRIILSDCQGKIVMDESYNSTSDQIYLELSSDIAPGLYIVKIDTYNRTYIGSIVINL